MKKEDLIQSGLNLLDKQPNQIALLSNASAFLNEVLKDINWVGFYLFDGNKLNVGPFQGKPACSVINIGAGVCGTSAKLRKTVVVKSVDEFEDHIACDANSKSEVVIPIIVNDSLFGVLDVDSPIYDRFDAYTVDFLEKFVALLVSKL